MLTNEEEILQETMIEKVYIGVIKGPKAEGEEDKDNNTEE